MAVLQFARRGDDVYENVVKPKLRPEDHGRFVAVDIDSHDFEVGDRGTNLDGSHRFPLGAPLPKPETAASDWRRIDPSAMR